MFAPSFLRKTIQVSLIEEIADQRGDRRGVGFQGEMAGIEEVDPRLRNVALERTSALR
jgi:hypothetical protein